MKKQIEIMTNCGLMQSVVIAYAHQNNAASYASYASASYASASYAAAHPVWGRLAKELFEKDLVQMEKLKRIVFYE